MSELYSAHCVIHHSYADDDGDQCLWAQQHYEEGPCVFELEAQ